MTDVVHCVETVLVCFWDWDFYWNETRVPKLPYGLDTFKWVPKTFQIGLNIEPVLDVCRTPKRVCARWFYMSVNIRKEFQSDVQISIQLWMYFSGPKAFKRSLSQALKYWTTFGHPWTSNKFSARCLKIEPLNAHRYLWEVLVRHSNIRPVLDVHWCSTRSLVRCSCVNVNLMIFDQSWTSVKHLKLVLDWLILYSYGQYVLRDLIASTCPVAWILSFLCSGMCT